MGTQGNILQTFVSLVEVLCREGQAQAVGIASGLLFDLFGKRPPQDCKIAIVHGWLNPNPFSHCLGSRVEEVGEVKQQQQGELTKKERRKTRRGSEGERKHQTSFTGFAASKLPFQGYGFKRTEEAAFHLSPGVETARR